MPPAPTSVRPMLATDLFVLKDVIRRASAPAKTRNISRDEVVSYTTSDEVEVAFLSQCRKCHHWHEGERQKIRLQRSRETEIKCRNCGYRMIVFNGLSRHRSLVSRETIVLSEENRIHAGSKVCLDESTTSPHSSVEVTSTASSLASQANALYSPPFQTGSATADTRTTEDTSPKSPAVKGQRTPRKRDVFFVNPFAPRGFEVNQTETMPGSRRGEIFRKIAKRIGRLCGLEISLQYSHRKSKPKVKDDSNDSGTSGRVRFSDPLATTASGPPAEFSSVGEESYDPVSTIGAASILQPITEPHLRETSPSSRQNSVRRPTSAVPPEEKDTDRELEYQEQIAEQRRLATEEANLPRICRCSPRCPCCSNLAYMGESGSMLVEPSLQDQQSISTRGFSESDSRPSIDGASEHRSSSGSSSAFRRRAVGLGGQFQPVGFGGQFQESSGSSSSWPSRRSTRIVTSTRSSTGDSRPSTGEPVPSLTASQVSLVEEPDEISSAPGPRHASLGQTAHSVGRSASTQSSSGANARHVPRIRTDEARRAVDEVSGRRGMPRPLSAVEDLTPTDEMTNGVEGTAQEQ